MCIHVDIHIYIYIRSLSQTVSETQRVAFPSAPYSFTSQVLVRAP